MADVYAAVQFVLGLEDSRLTGEITTLPGDRGGPTRFGLASKSHPDLVAQGYYEADKIPHDEALAIAEQTYAEGYANPVKLASVTSQDVANRILSFAINEGPQEAVAILQRALNGLGNSLGVDGLVGPATLAAVNASDPTALINALRGAETQFYRNLVAARPALLPDLAGLINRANA